MVTKRAARPSDRADPFVLSVDVVRERIVEPGACRCVETVAGERATHVVIARQT
jgi:hypothetical protein